MEQSAPQRPGWDGSASQFNSFHSSVDPDEMFRKIFGEFVHQIKWKPKAWIDFPEGKYGFAPSQEAIINLNFKEAARGCVKTVTVNVLNECIKCKGSRFLLKNISVYVLLLCFGLELIGERNQLFVRFAMEED